MKTMYDIIKRQNGEAFAKAILHYDASLFEMDNLPRIVKFAGRNALPILATLKRIKNGELGVKTKKEGKSPYELLAEAGYDAYYADTLEKQNAIQKYFAPGEELCTFRDSNRFKSFYIIHAVKKNVDEIKRADFVGREDRQDEYGTSVISIQVHKGGGFISIKNRYNHKVKNPDNTFDSDPDKIIEGLSDSIKKEFETDFETLPGLYVYCQGMILNYKGECEGVYAGEDFFLRYGQVYEIDKDKELLVHLVLLLDMKEKKFKNLIVSPGYYNWYDERGSSAPIIELQYLLNEEIEGKKLQVTRDKKENRTTLFADGEMVLSLTDGIIDMLHLKKAHCLNYFPDDYLTRNLKYYDGVSTYKKWGCYSRRHSPAGSVPYTYLPKPPVMKLAEHIKRQGVPVSKQAGRQNDGN